MRRRMLARAAIVFLALFASSYIAVYATCWHRVQRAKALIEQLQQLEVGNTPESQVRKLVDQYGGTFTGEHEQNRIPQPASYDVGINPPYILVGGSAHTLPGQRQWGLIASLEVEHGYLSNLYLSLGILRADGFGLHSTVRLTGTHRLAAPDGVPYYVYEAHITGPPGEALGAELAPAATAGDRKKGFDFNLSCLTALRECRHVCDTFPSVWNDLTLRGRLTYEDGTPVYDYRECRKGMR